MPTREEILRDAARLRVLEDAKRLADEQRVKEEAAYAASQARPLERAEPTFPTFAPPSVIERQLAESARKQAEAEVARVAFPQESVTAAQAEAERKAREAADLARARTVMPGVERPATPGVLPMFRPSRIEERLTILPEPVPGTGVLLDEELRKLERVSPTRVPVDQPSPIDPGPLLRKQAPQITRLYRDPETGELRPPTAGEEAIEAFAQQTETSEARFREEQIARERRQQEIDRAIERGEEVPLLDRVDLSQPLGILSREGEGKGVVETPLGATLRGGLSWLSAAAAEGYFRGLGYEVDEKGLPVDPDDFGLAVAQARESLGIPATLPISASLAIPLPGVATTRQTRKVTTFDPEGRRSVTDVEAPSFFESPKEFARFEARRIAENVAKGRTMADEFLDTPAVRDYYAKYSGDPNNAFYAGLLVDVFTPAGPGTVARGLAKLADTAADVAKVSAKAQATQAVLDASQELRAVKDTIETARTRGIVPAALRQQEAAATRRVEDLKLQAEAGTSPKVVRNVGAQAVKKVITEPERKPAIIAAIKQPGVATSADVARAAEQAGATPDEALRIGRLTFLNTPADYEALTDAIAVPRTRINESREILNNWRKTMFVRSVDRMGEELLLRATQLPPENTRLIEEMRAVSRQLSGQIGNYGYDALEPALRKRVETLVRSAARIQGQDPARAVKLFDQRTPAEAARVFDSGIAAELGRYASWDDVPATLRRRAIDSYDVGALPLLGRGARSASDLTRAQMFFRSAEGALNSRFFDSPRARRLIAQYAPPRTESLSAARTAKEIALAGKTSLRNLRTRFAEEVSAAGNVEDGLNNLLRKELDASGETPEQAWDALYGHLYGDRAKDNALAVARSILGDNLPFPTLEQVRALDTLLLDQKIVRGIRPPDFEAGFLKVTLENGLKKSISKTKRDTQLAEAASRLTRPEGGLLLGYQTAEQALEARMRALPLPARAAPVEVPRAFDEFSGQRLHVYDLSAGEAERQLATGVADGLFTVLDDIPVRARGDGARYYMDILESVVGPARRDIMQRMKYGYIVPNLITQGGRLLQLAIVPIATIGAVDTLEAAGRLGVKALEAVGARRVLGGGITDVNGVYYSPKVLDDLANDYGLGVTALESERVGSLANDLLKEVRRQATLGRATPLANAFSALNPLDKGFFLRVAEAIELNFRKSVFELALARGDAPAEAAELARKSQFNYAETPDFIQQSMGQYLGESAGLYQATTEALLRVKDNPQAATAVLKALRAKAEVQDPYNIHGDKALKSLGIITTDDGTYYLPETPILRPIESVLGMARRADLWAQQVAQARKAEGDLAAVYEGAVGGGALALRTGADLLLPGVLDAYDRFEEGEEYVTTGVPEATPMSDEKVFWTLLLAAHQDDPDRLPGGQWSTFTSYFTPEIVEPPSNLRDAETGYWTKQPPEGMPHLYMGEVDGKSQYLAVKPSKAALRNISVIRAVTPDVIERLFPLYNFLGDQDFAPTSGPVRVYGETLLPETATEAAMEAVLPKTTMTTEEARRQQAEGVRAIREQVR